MVAEGVSRSARSLTCSLDRLPAKAGQIREMLSSRLVNRKGRQECKATSRERQTGFAEAQLPLAAPLRLAE